MSQPTVRYHAGAERPALSLWLLDDDGSLVDLDGYAVTLKIGVLGSAATLTKSTGCTGATGAGVEPTGTPNCTVTWTADELDGLTANRRYAATLRATADGLTRIWQFWFEVIPVVT